MAQIVREERRQRGVFGWLVLLLFWAFNAWMIYALFAGIAAVAPRGPETAAEEAGRSIGTGIGVTFIVVIWAAGAVILGLMALLTRGRVIVIERDTGPAPSGSRGRRARSDEQPTQQLIATAAPEAPRAPPRPPQRTLPPALQYDRDWLIEIVGESNYQDAIVDALRNARAHEHLRIVMLSLEPERDNPHDSDAVRVAFRNATVGYLPRARARQYRQTLGGQASSCSGAIFAGGDSESEDVSFGVWLNAAWPPRFK